MSQRLAASSLLIPLAAGLSLWTYGRAQADPAAGAETLYLALLVTVALLPVAALAVRPALELGIPAVLVAAAVWVVPAGPARGAAVGLLLLSTLGAATLRRLEAEDGRLTWGLAIPLALALQLLLRADRLVGLQVDLRQVVGLIGLPVAAAVALLALARRRRGGPVLVAGGAALVLVPGYSVSVTLALLALAAADLARDGDVPRWLRWAAPLLVGGVALVWEPILALPLVAAGLLHAGRGTWRVALPVAAVVALATLVLPPVRNAGQWLHQLALVPLLLPACVTLVRRRPAVLLAGTVIAAGALRLVPDPGALAAPLALLALALAEREAGEELQLLWSGLLVAGTALLATYPWVRDLPLLDATSLLALPPGWPGAALVVAAFLLLAHGAAALRSRWPGRVPGPVPLALALLALAVFAALPQPSVRPLAESAVVLDADRGRLARDLPQPAPVGEVVVDSYLSDSAGLAAGTPVADLRVFTTDGRRYDWTLRAGVESGEWAARREDVVRLPGFVAPAPWLSWVAPGGNLLAQRYRSRWRPVSVTGEPLAARRVEIVRRGELPAGVALAVFHLELRP